MFSKFLTATAVSVALTGCGGGGSSSGGGTPIEVEPDIYEASRVAIVDNLLAVNDMNVALDLPATGSATYEGQFGMILSGDTNAAMIGDMEMTAAFASGNVTGTASDFVAVDEFGYYTPAGSLDIDGSVIGATVSGNATGRLGIFDSRSGGDIAQVDFDLDLDGVFRTPAGSPVEGTVVDGLIDGSGSGDLDVKVIGDFVGEDQSAPLLLLNQP